MTPGRSISASFEIAASLPIRHRHIVFTLLHFGHVEIVRHNIGAERLQGKLATAKGVDRFNHRLWNSRDVGRLIGIPEELGGWLEFTLDASSRDAYEAAAHGYASLLALARIAGDAASRPRARARRGRS